MKLYLNLDEYGTPHWLGPLGRIDRTFIREYYHTQWKEGHPRLYDANPNRWPAGSPDSKGGEFAPKGISGARADWIREKIDAVADKMHFPRDRIHMSTGTYMFELNGEMHRAGGIAIYSNDGFTQPDTGEHYGKGDIVIYGRRDTGFDEDFPVRPTVAHEIQHQMFKQVLDVSSEEFAHAYNNNPNLIDEKTYQFKQDLLEEYKNTYPVSYALGSVGWGSEELYRKLEEEDGVTAYSKEYWDAVSEDKPGSTRLAINETLAEIASLKESEEARIWDKDTGNQMTEHLRNWLKSEYETGGSSFADPEEHQSQMADPWAYSEMMHKSEGDKEFKKKFGTSIENIKGFRMNGEPIYFRPVWTDYPDPVIRPIWLRLFDTFQQQYKRINNVKDAGFDPNQERDEHGQWTETGAAPKKVLKLGSKMRTVPTNRDGWPSTQATLDLYKTGYINPMNDAEVVWSEDDKIGMLEFGPAHDENTMYLKHIRTHPQRKGFGRKVMEELQSVAAEKGLGIWLEVARNSDTPFKALKKFYTSLGFEPYNRSSDEMIWRPKGKS